MKIHENKRKGLTGIIMLAVYFIVIVLVMLRAYRNPEYNWDMLAYIAVVIGREQNDIGEIHRKTYEAAKDHLPPAAFQQLINPANAYRDKMYHNDSAFYAQLPFYVIKPLYTSLVGLFGRAGFSLPAATVLPSIAAYLGMAILLLIWFGRHLPLFYAAGSAMLIMTSAPLLTVVALSTPDALSGLILLGVFYFVIEKPILPLMIVLLVAALFTRLDNIIACLLLVFFMAATKQTPFKISRAGYITLFAGLCVGYLLIAHRAKAFGFGIFFYPSFMQYMNMPHQYQSVFSLQPYLEVMHSVALTGLYHSALILFGFLGLLLFYKNAHGPWRGLSFYHLLPVLFLLIIIVRFVMDPDISDRFYIPYYLLIAALWVSAWGKNNFSVLQTGK